MARCGLCGKRMEVQARAHKYDNPDGSRIYEYLCSASKKNFPDCKGVYRRGVILDRRGECAFFSPPTPGEGLEQHNRRAEASEAAQAEGDALVTHTEADEGLRATIVRQKREG